MWWMRSLPRASRATRLHRSMRGRGSAVGEKTGDTVRIQTEQQVTLSLSGAGFSCGVCNKPHSFTHILDDGNYRGYPVIAIHLQNELSNWCPQSEGWAKSVIIALPQRFYSGVEVKARITWLTLFLQCQTFILYTAVQSENLSVGYLFIQPAGMNTGNRSHYHGQNAKKKLTDIKGPHKTETVSRISKIQLQIE